MIIERTIAEYVRQQREFSYNTFGPGPRTEGVLEHISKEVEEVRNDPRDIKEWVDIAILAIDGAWRAGWSPEAIEEAFFSKLETNKNREWPDWRNAPKNKAIEHIRG